VGERHPTRFAGLAAVDLNRPMEAVRELRRCVTDLGFKGLRVVPWLWEAPPTDRRYYALFAACVDLGVPFFTQVGHTGPLRPSETGRPIPYIDQIALDFPELVIVGGHIGYPWTEETIAVARKHENVYVDTSAYTAKRYPPELVEYMKSRSGRKKRLAAVPVAHLAKQPLCCRRHPRVAILPKRSGIVCTAGTRSKRHCRRARRRAASAHNIGNGRSQSRCLCRGLSASQADRDAGRGQRRRMLAVEHLGRSTVVHADASRRD
jgi:hypothetical protein